MKTTFKCRSLANLTAHKRSYCQEKFESVTHVFDTMAGVEAAQLQTVLVQAEEVLILISITLKITNRYQRESKKDISTYF